MEKPFLEIVEKNQGIIYKVCNIYRDTKEDQEDLFQEIVMQLWKAYPKFRNESKVSTWMYRIALNTAIAIFRKNKIELEFKEKVSPELHLKNNDESSENAEDMFEAIRRLSEIERAIIALFLEDYSYKEIGQITGITENYVGVKMSRIKDKLRKFLK